MHFKMLASTSLMIGLSASRSAFAQDVSPPPSDPNLLAPEPPPGPPLVLPPEPCGLLRHPCRYPHLEVALDAGLSSFNESGPFGFQTGIGTVTNFGAGWGARVGVALASFFAIDVHYIGMFNNGQGPADAIGFFTSALTGELRFTLPIKYVQPYLLAGAGIYSSTITGTDEHVAASGFHSSTELGVPLGIGVQVPVNRAMNVGVEMVYHRFFGEGFYVDDDNPIGGGDLLTINLVLRAKL